MADDVKLTLEEEKKVLELWNSRKDNPPSLPETVEHIFGPNVDARSKQGRAVRTFLASRQISVPKLIYIPKPKIELTAEQKEYISNNCSTQSWLEMARTLSQNPALEHLSQFARAVKEYFDGIPDKIKFKTDQEELTIGEYKSPNTVEKVVKRINQYVHNNLDIHKLSPAQKKDVRALMGYLHTYRFITHIKTFATQTDLELFESTFVRMCYDKSDLTEEEVDMYIMYSGEVVTDKSICKRIEMFTKRLEDDLANNNGKVNTAFVESITALRNELNQCRTRQTKLMESLQGKRSERMENRKKEVASILSLVELWKGEETRQKIIKMNELRKEKLKTALEELGTMDELKAAIYGVDINTVLNG